MAKRSGSITTLISLILLVAGVGLAFWGYQMSGSVSSKITQAVSGSASDKVMMLYIGGAASFIAGLYLYFKK